MQLDHWNYEPVAQLLVDMKDRRIGSVVGGPHTLVAELDRLGHRLVLQRARDAAAAHLLRGRRECRPWEPPHRRKLEVREADDSVAFERDPETILANSWIVEREVHPFFE